MKGLFSDYDKFMAALDDMSAGFTMGVTTAEDRKRDTLPRNAKWCIEFETTTFYFNDKGRYVGRLYMDRDECDYFTARGART